MHPNHGRGQFNSRQPFHLIGLDTIPALIQAPEGLLTSRSISHVRKTGFTNLAMVEYTL
jgi:hypothetical protein